MRIKMYFKSTLLDVIDVIDVVVMLYSAINTEIDLTSPSISTRTNRHLRSAEEGLLHVSFACTSAVQSRAFSVVGPWVWNGLSMALCSIPRVFSQKFLQQLKATLFGHVEVGSASE